MADIKVYCRGAVTLKCSASAINLRGRARALTNCRANRLSRGVQAREREILHDELELIFIRGEDALPGRLRELEN